MMIPITRKEKYINEIVGGGDTAPETPQTREEFFFAEILGEVIAPSPITRAEKYLAKIANKYNGELPEPVTRIERFLARAAGMNVSIPTPITREEMFWADYALIVEKELSGIPPLTFKAKKAGTLKNYRIYGNTETKTRSYSGSAPLSFPIADGSVSNYRIYGNTVNGGSVGDLVTDSQSEHYGNYAIPITNNSETANIYLDEPLKMVEDEAEYVDFEEQKQHRVRKNLLPNEATSRTINGVAFTVNNDGSVTCNGTASNIVFYVISSEAFSLPVGRYKLNGAPTGGGQNYNFKLDVRVSTNKYYPDTGNGGQFSILQGEPITLCRIVIYSGYTCNNLTFYPMIRKADIEDDTYEPYIENTEVDVIVPALPAQSSTNSLSVDTTVQPSSVAVDVSEVVSCGDKVTDSQSVNYGKYKIPVTLTVDSAETTDIYLDEPLRKVGNESDYIDYAEQKQHRVRKNLLNIETDIIPLGFQYGTVTIFNDSNVKGFFKECEPNTAYTISRKTSSNNRFSIGFSAEEPSNTSTVVLLSYTTPLDTSTTSLTSISPANAKYICCYLSNRGDDITEALEIMLEKNDRATDYEPYITNTELDVTLPALPVLPGTNTLTVGTEVQPSNVYIKYEGAR